DGGNYQECVNPRPLEAILHRLQSLDGAEWLARGFGINGADDLGKVLQRWEVPQAILGEDTEQPLAVPPHVALAQLGRQLVQGDLRRRGNVAQSMQVLRK